MSRATPPKRSRRAARAASARAAAFRRGPAPAESEAHRRPGSFLIHAFLAEVESLDFRNARSEQNCAGVVAIHLLKPKPFLCVQPRFGQKKNSQLVHSDGLKHSDAVKKSLEKVGAHSTLDCNARCWQHLPNSRGLFVQRSEVQVA